MFSGRSAEIPTVAIMGFHTPSRRDLLRTLAIGGAAATALALPGSGIAEAAGAGDLIMIIRHAEKPADDDSGVKLDGSASKHSLIVRGWQRAGALASLFDPSGGAVRSGLATPTAIYASEGGDSDSDRPLETITPTADELGLTPDTDYSVGQEADLAAAITARSGATLVSWQHEDIPAIVAALGAVSPPPPASWPDDRFDMVWVFTRTSGGWTFTQVPQLLLAGDSATPIS